MSDKKRALKQLIITVIIIGVLGALAGAHALINTVQKSNCDQTTIATIESYKRVVAGERLKFQLKCSYVVDGVKYEGYEIGVHRILGLSKDSLIGGKILISYNSKSPEKFYIEDDAIYDIYFIG